MASSPEQLLKQLKSPSTIVVGNKPLGDRALWKLFTSPTTKLMVALGLLVHTVDSNFGFLYADDTPGRAKIIAKIHNPQGDVLSVGTQMWMSTAIHKNPAHVLVLEIPGQDKTVSVSVSPDIFSQLCLTNTPKADGEVACAPSTPRLDVSYVKPKDPSPPIIQTVASYTEFQADLKHLLGIRIDPRLELAQKTTNPKNG